MYQLFRVFTVHENERAFLIRNGRFQRVLKPGRYRYFDFAGRIEVEKHNVVDAEISSPIVKFIEKEHPALATEFFEIVQTGEGEVAIVSFDDVPVHLVGPWRKRYFWRVVTKVKTELIDTAKKYRISKAHLNAIDTASTNLVVEEVVGQHEAGLLYIDGEFAERLMPGRHAFWSVHRKVQIEKFDLRPVPHEITAQEILTKDRVSLRATLTAFTQVIDPEKVMESSSDYATYIYRLVQFAVREAISTRTLDEVLNNRETVDKQIRTYVDEHLGDIGVKITSLGLKDIILPGEMRGLINQVVEAEKIAQANLIRRREETAATRSLLNTARLMENNPLLLRLKEIEALEKLTEKVGKIELITGKDTSGFDGLLQNLLRIDAGKSSGNNGDESEKE